MKHSTIYVYVILYCHFCISCDRDHRELTVLTHSFPTRRSSDLINTEPRARRAIIAQRCGGAGKLAGAMDQRLHVGFDIAATVIGRQPPAAECAGIRSEEHTSELQSLMRISYAVFCLNKKKVHHNSSQ